MSAEGQIATQLRYAIAPFRELLADPLITDIHIGGAGPLGKTPVFIKRLGRRERREINLTAKQLEQIGSNAAVLGGGQLTGRMPFSPGRFPDRQRVQIACEPAVPEGRYALSVRSGMKRIPTPQELEEWGVFDETEPSEAAKPRQGTEEILALKAGRKWRLMIEDLYRYNYNVVFAGPVNSGKTTNLLSFYNVVPRGRRVLTVQDTNELEQIPQEDVVHFIYPKDTGGVAQHTAENCVEACLRMDMDEIVNGEVRDGAAWALMRAANSGHNFKTSCHAPSADGAFNALVGMAKQHEVARSFKTDDLRATLYQLVDAVVFSDIVDDKRRVTEIWFDPAAKKGLPNSVKHSLAVEDV